MQLILLGTGCPSVDHKRFGPANLISTRKTTILVDCGSGVTQRLKEAKVSSANIDALFLTHLHSDHVVDLYQLIISSWHSYRTKSWRIFGPIGTKKFVKKLMDVWKDERMLRIKYEQRSSIQAFNVKVTEFGEYGKTRIKDLAVEYFTVDHKPVKYAYGFNFFQQKKKLTISGDTKPCENLMKYGQLADVLLHEVFIEDEIYSYFRMRTKKTLHNVKAYHTPSTIVGKVAKITRCKKLVLTHFVPTQFNEKKLIDVVTKDFGKKPVIGKDLLKITI
ncbi:MAG: MBL fold metallo-hydrolase [Pelagibacteraceae bacterium]|jgi:ribonuclease Z|nr:MBL fold metallo-hydrolase [Pelagibacteraceae bacterium]HJO13459.1 MBL fold metallo-hydrolase [Alphaproteobacteria bacterium]MBO6466775.1 MBL fold metallo-hydrolase [Pelagibacteraceae bacterium]MBO6467346.1 MBL fold metallo-hydrolase [Pelagibacteraceae bacterium]MBO6470131.1 MBL fold metallo-hydrolase [Pelagibacteraceae bacterium]|tara:strand:+ start:371 stop:1198 length:828 start_codon:yes stop_codon:yes gene_type:complete